MSARRGRALALAAALSLLLATGCRESRSPASLYARDSAALKRGELLFAGVCGAYCHGLQPGARDAPYLFDCEWKHGGEDGNLFRVIEQGVPGTRMPAFGGKLPEGEQDVWKLIAYLRAGSACR
jgi:mono/diheme cytochrome c family protein